MRVLSGTKKRVVLGTILADDFFFYVNIALRLAKKNFCGFLKKDTLVNKANKISETNSWTLDLD